MTRRGFSEIRVWSWRLAPVCLVAAVSPASADGSLPGLQAEFSIEIENERVFRSSIPEAEINDAFATVEADLGIAFESGTGLYATAILEPVIDPEKDRFFEGFGLYLEELYFDYRIGEGGVRLGKFNPSFGLTEDVAPGIYGDDLAGDYELEERIGASIEVPFEALGGTHVASATVFMADTTVLSDSLFNSRGRIRRADGGVSNTKYPESFVVSLDGEIGRTGYSLGFRRQDAGRNVDEGEEGEADEDGEESTEGEAEEDFRKDEYGFVLGLTHTIDVASVETMLFGEFAYFPNFDGEMESVRFLTFGAEAALGDFALSAIYGLRKFEALPVDRIAAVSLEYELREGLTIATGYRYLEEERESSHTVGLLLTYEFGVP